MERQLRCVIQKGMFSDERVIIVNVPGGLEIDFFVPSNMVNEQNGTVRVFVISNAPSGNPYAVIPTPRRPAVEVKESDLMPA